MLRSISKGVETDDASSLMPSAQMRRYPAPHGEQWFDSEGEAIRDGLELRRRKERRGYMG